MVKRIYIKHTKLDEGGYEGNSNADHLITTYEEANLVISATEHGLHAPVIDFDIPIEVYPSSQLGHHHLYINKEISWLNYVKILTTFVDAGLVEPGYRSATLHHGYSCVRKPGILKPGVPSKTANVLKENALLRKENYALKEQLHKNKLNIATAVTVAKELIST